MEQLDQQVAENSRETRMQVEANRERNMEVGMLKDQVAMLREQLRQAGDNRPAPPPPAPAGLAGADAAKVQELDQRISEAERKCADIPPLKDQLGNMKDQIHSLRDAAGVPPPIMPTGTADEGLERRVLELEQTSDDLIDEVKAIGVGLVALKQNVSSGGGGDMDDVVMEDLTKIKANISSMRKDLDQLKSFKEAKEAESVILQKVDKGLREAKARYVKMEEKNSKKNQLQQHRRS